VHKTAEEKPGKGKVKPVNPRCNKWRY